MGLNWSSYIIMLLFVIYLCLAAAQAQQGYPRGGPAARFNDVVVTENIDFINNRYPSNDVFSNNNGYRNNNGYPNSRPDQFQGYPDSRENELDASGAIQGRAGVDYPVFSSVPPTRFSCSQQQYPGYYADPEAQCQAFHICQQGGRQDSFLCPNGTLFNQVYLVCDSWNNVDCSQASEVAVNVNEAVFRDMQAAADQRQGYQYNQADAGGYSQSRQATNNVRSFNQDLGFARAAPLTEYSPRAVFGTDVQTPRSQYGAPSNNFDNQFNARSNVQNSNYDVGTPRSQYGAPRNNFDNQFNARSNVQNSNYDFGTPSSQYGAPRNNGNGQFNTRSNVQNSNYDARTPSTQYGTPRTNFDSQFNARSSAPSSRYGVPNSRSFLPAQRSQYESSSASRTYLPPGK